MQCTLCPKYSHKHDISSYTNADIAHLVLKNEIKRLNTNPKSEESRRAFFLTKLVEYSSLMADDSNLWVEFQRLCHQENRSDILSKNTHNLAKD